MLITFHLHLYYRSLCIVYGTCWHTTTTTTTTTTINRSRETFPWLMTWEENNSRPTPPWSGRELCRGLEVSSYAFATSKKENVERGKLFDTPCYEWLDGNESKATSFYLSLQVVSGISKTGAELCDL